MSDEHDPGADGPDGPGCEPGGYSLIDTAPRPPRADGPPYAECVLCREPTEYPESYKGVTLCPVCEWQEAQRTACSG
ncbi:hypothetical protein [Streptomyces sp. MH60]|uniref:hypothetical protein n=1 Tax=Streptomyces sp. MH60 TaxID=1940758 RepID=UPI000CEF4F3A|nr:hypothetical protein [Streptomyces sp. MH60]PPS79198.1 hypothetical protein BZZ08_06303 [Streptomyces sp. MH60]